MKLRIVSDGTPHGTVVLNAETGEPLQHVVEVVIRIAATRPAQAVVTVDHVEVEVIADSEEGD